MSSGPLDFFELNITCSANTECYTHGLNLECRRTGYCGCMWSSSMGPAPVCNELTPASSMNLVVRFLTLALYLVPFVYALQLYIFTIRKSGCKWSYQISTVVFTILGPFFMLLANIMPLIDMLGGAVFSTVARNAIFNLGLALGSTLCILSYLNVSLMWVEFCLASKRLAALSHNLKLTKNFLRGYIVFHVVMSVIMLVLNVVVSDTFFLAFLGVVVIAAILILVSYQWGSRKIVAIYQKHAAAEKKTIATMAAGPERSEKDASALEQSKATVSAFERRAKQIRQTANYMCSGIGGFLVGAFLYVIGSNRMSLVVYWIGALILHAGVTFALVFVCRFVGFSLRPGREGLGSMRGGSSRTQTRVSERSNRSNTTGDDQSTPGGFSQRATDGAAPEEKPAEAYIKLTNASLRDQNPDEDEEEDEYYKWKAAKANQVAPEP